MDERRLIEAAARGDRAAFEALARQVHALGYRIARRILGNAEDAADVAQQALLKLWGALPHYQRRRGGFRSWYTKMVVNLSIDQHRRLRLQRRFEAVAEPRHGASVDSQEPEPSSAFSASEVERVFEQVAAFLSSQQRAAFTLVEIEGLSSAEAAAAMGVRPSTVRNHLRVARSVLQEQMRRQFPEYCRGY